MATIYVHLETCIFKLQRLVVQKAALSQRIVLEENLREQLLFKCTPIEPHDLSEEPDVLQCSVP
jgi:hypothetical protein